MKVMIAEDIVVFVIGHKHHPHYRGVLVADTQYISTSAREFQRPYLSCSIRGVPLSIDI
jgi:hypothetical protein